MADTDNNSNIVVEAVGLTKVFKDFWGRPKARAVNGIDFKIRQGEVFGLLGPNGSGKSTTIKMILGLLYPTRGKLEVFGQDPQNVDMKSRIGYLPEETFLYKYLTAYETLDFYGALFGLNAEQRKVRATQLLEMVGLSHAFDRPVGEFSKGMARRIGLAQALVNDPDLVILDEPTSGLDPIGCREVKDVIRLLASRGKTIILCSHLLADVQDVCNSVTVLFGGQIRAQGALSEILCESDKTQIITPRLSPETISELRNFLKAHGLKNIDAVKIDNPDRNLEDYFLDVVRKASEQNVATAGAQSNGEIPEYLQGSGNDSSRAILDALRRRPEEEQTKAAVAAAEAKLKEATEAAKARQLEQLQEFRTDDNASAKQAEAVAASDAEKEAEAARKREELNKKLASLRK